MKISLKIRLISAFVAFVFAFTNTLPPGYSQGVFSTTDQIEIPYADLTLPPELGSVTQSQFSASGPFLFHLETVHGDPGTQRQIQKVLSDLARRYRLRLIFAEGASEKLNPEFLRFFPDRRKNTEMTERMLEKGIYTGVDLFLLKPHLKFPGPSMEALGIESAPIYRAAYQNFKKVLRNQSDFEEDLEKIESSLDQKANQVLPNRTFRLLKQWKRYEKGEFPVLSYFNFLSDAARRELELDFRDPMTQLEWPQWVRFVLLQEFQKGLSLNKAGEEREKVLKRFRGGSLPKIGEVPGNPRRLFERFLTRALPQGFRFEEYPQFGRWAAVEILQSELDPRLLKQESDRLWQKLKRVCFQSEESRRLVERHESFFLLTKLLHLELNRAEWKEAQGRDLLSMFRTRSPFRQILVRAFAFYRLAERREKIFLAKLEKEMERRGERKAALVTGGFHTEGMEALFKEKGWGYASVTPRILHDVRLDNYQNVMLGRSHLERTEFPQSPAAVLNQGWSSRSEMRRVRKLFWAVEGPHQESSWMRTPYAKAYESSSRSEVRGEIRHPERDPFGSSEGSQTRDPSPSPLTESVSRTQDDILRAEVRIAEEAHFEIRSKLDLKQPLLLDQLKHYDGGRLSESLWQLQNAVEAREVRDSKGRWLPWVLAAAGSLSVSSLALFPQWNPITFLIDQFLFTLLFPALRKYRVRWGESSFLKYLRAEIESPMGFWNRSMNAKLTAVRLFWSYLSDQDLRVRSVAMAALEKMGQEIAGLKTQLEDLKRQVPENWFDPEKARDAVVFGARPEKRIPGLAPVPAPSRSEVRGRQSSIPSPLTPALSRREREKSFRAEVREKKEVTVLKGVTPASDRFDEEIEALSKWVDSLPLSEAGYMLSPSEVFTQMNFRTLARTFWEEISGFLATQQLRDWRELERLPSIDSRVKELLSFLRVKFHKQSSFMRYFWEKGERREPTSRFLHFKEALSKKIRSMQAKGRVSLRISVFGPGFMQQPIEILMMVLDALQQSGVGENQARLVINVFDLRDDSGMNQKILRNRIFYDPEDVDRLQRAGFDIQSYFEKSSRGYRLKDAYHRRFSFAFLDLNGDLRFSAQIEKESQDFIFVDSVLGYFKDRSQGRAVMFLYDFLKPEGVLYSCDIEHVLGAARSGIGNVNLEDIPQEFSELEDPEIPILMRAGIFKKGHFKATAQELVANIMSSRSRARSEVRGKQSSLRGLPPKAVGRSNLSSGIASAAFGNLAMTGRAEVRQAAQPGTPRRSAPFEPGAEVREKTNLTELFRESMEFLRKRWSSGESGPSLKIEFDRENPIFVLGGYPKNEFRPVLGELVLNALERSPPNEVVRIRLKSDWESARLEVTSRGEIKWEILRARALSSVVYRDKTSGLLSIYSLPGIEESPAPLSSEETRLLPKEELLGIAGLNESSRGYRGFGLYMIRAILRRWKAAHLEISSQGGETTFSIVFPLHPDEKSAERTGPETLNRWFAELARPGVANLDWLSFVDRLRELVKQNQEGTLPRFLRAFERILTESSVPKIAQVAAAGALDEILQSKPLPPVTGEILEILDHGKSVARDAAVKDFISQILEAKGRRVMRRSKGQPVSEETKTEAVALPRSEVRSDPIDPSTPPSFGPFGRRAEVRSEEAGEDYIPWKGLIGAKVVTTHYPKENDIFITVAPDEGEKWWLIMAKGDWDQAEALHKGLTQYLQDFSPKEADELIKAVIAFKNSRPDNPMTIHHRSSSGTFSAEKVWSAEWNPQTAEAVRGTLRILESEIRYLRRHYFEDGKLSLLAIGNLQGIREKLAGIQELFSKINLEAIEFNPVTRSSEQNELRTGLENLQEDYRQIGLALERTKIDLERWEIFGGGLLGIVVLWIFLRGVWWAAAGAGLTGLVLLFWPKLRKGPALFARQTARAEVRGEDKDQGIAQAIIDEGRGLAEKIVLFAGREEKTASRELVEAIHELLNWRREHFSKGDEVIVRVQNSDGEESDHKVPWIDFQQFGITFPLRFRGRLSDQAGLTEEEAQAAKDWDVAYMGLGGADDPIVADSHLAALKDAFRRLIDLSFESLLVHLGITSDLKSHLQTIDETLQEGGYSLTSGKLDKDPMVVTIYLAGEDGELLFVGDETPRAISIWVKDREMIKAFTRSEVREKGAVTVRRDDANGGFVWVGDGVREVRVNAEDAGEIERVKRQFLTGEIEKQEEFEMESLGVRVFPYVVWAGSSAGFGLKVEGRLSDFSIPSVGAALSTVHFPIAPGREINISPDPSDPGSYWIEDRNRRRRKLDIENFRQIDRALRFVLSSGNGSPQTEENETIPPPGQILERLTGTYTRPRYFDWDGRSALTVQEQQITQESRHLLESLADSLRRNGQPGLTDKEFRSFLGLVRAWHKETAPTDLVQQIFSVIWYALEKEPSLRGTLIESITSTDESQLVGHPLFEFYLLLLSMKSFSAPSAGEARRITDFLSRYKERDPVYYRTALAALAEQTGKEDFTGAELDLLLEGIKGATIEDPRSGVVQRFLFKRHDLVERLIGRFPIDLRLESDRVEVSSSYQQGLEKLVAGEPAFRSLLLNSRNLTSLVQRMTVLRQIYGFGNARRLRAPPFERILAGKRYFRIGPTIYLAPDPSFRRHFLFKMQDNGKVDFILQMKIPGNPHDKPRTYLVHPDNVDIPAALLRLAPDAPFQKPFALLQLPGDSYDLAYSREPIEFNEWWRGTPFYLALFEYSLDGNRLSDFRPEDLPRDREGLARKVLGMAALVHHLGYRGHNVDGYDLHPENFILRVTESGFKIQLVDFEAYGPLSQDVQVAAHQIDEDLSHMIETHSRIPGLSSLLEIPAARLKQIYREEKEKLKLSRSEVRAVRHSEPRSISFSGRRISDPEILRSALTGLAQDDAWLRRAEVRRKTNEDLEMEIGDSEKQRERQTIGVNGRDESDAGVPNIVRRDKSQRSVWRWPPPHKPLLRKRSHPRASSLSAGHTAQPTKKSINKNTITVKRNPRGTDGAKSPDATSNTFIRSIKVFDTSSSLGLANKFIRQLLLGGWIKPRVGIKININMIKEKSPPLAPQSWRPNSWVSARAEVRGYPLPDPMGFNPVVFGQTLLIFALVTIVSFKAARLLSLKMQIKGRGIRHQSDEDEIEKEKNNLRRPVFYLSFISLFGTAALAFLIGQEVIGFLLGLSLSLYWGGNLETRYEIIKEGGAWDYFPLRLKGKSYLSNLSDLLQWVGGFGFLSAAGLQQLVLARENPTILRAVISSLVILAITVTGIIFARKIYQGEEKETVPSKGTDSSKSPRSEVRGIEKRDAAPAVLSKKVPGTFRGAGKSGSSRSEVRQRTSSSVIARQRSHVLTKQSQSQRSPRPALRAGFSILSYREKRAAARIVKNALRRMRFPELLNRYGITRFHMGLVSGLGYGALGVTRHSDADIYLLVQYPERPKVTFPSEDPLQIPYHFSAYLAKELGGIATMAARGFHDFHDYIHFPGKSHPAIEELKEALSRRGIEGLEFHIWPMIQEKNPWRKALFLQTFDLEFHELPLLSSEPGLRKKLLKRSLRLIEEQGLKEDFDEFRVEMLEWLEATEQDHIQRFSLKIPENHQEKKYRDRYRRKQALRSEVRSGGTSLETLKERIGRLERDVKNFQINTSPPAEREDWLAGLSGRLFGLYTDLERIKRGNGSPREDPELGRASGDLAAIATDLEELEALLPPPVVFGLARKEDVDEIVKLRETDYIPDVRGRRTFNAEEDRKFFEGVISGTRQAPGVLITARKRGKLIGYILAFDYSRQEDTPGEGRITEMTVKRDERWKGVGTGLMTEALAWLKARPGVTKIKVRDASKMVDSRHWGITGKMAFRKFDFDREGDSDVYVLNVNREADKRSELRGEVRHPERGPFGPSEGSQTRDPSPSPRTESVSRTQDDIMRRELERASKEGISREAVLALAEQVGTFDPALTKRALRRLALMLKRRQAEKEESRQRRGQSPFPRSFARLRHSQDDVVRPKAFARYEILQIQDDFEGWLYALTGKFVNSSS